MPRPLLLAAVLLTGCLPAQPRLAAPPTPHADLEGAPAFDVYSFFEGETAGLGVLYVRGRSPVIVRVESRGTVLEGGDLELVQTITRGDADPYSRTWTFRDLGGGRYTGELTEATGPVEAEVIGDRLEIRYRTGRVTTVAQTLRLQPGGRLALNLLTVRVLGVPVARLVEQIRGLEGTPRS